MTSFGWTELIGLSLSPLAWLYQTFTASDLAAPNWAANVQAGLLALLVALLLDRLWGEPPVWLHPVVLMGKLLGWSGQALAPRVEVQSDYLRFGLAAIVWCALAALFFMVYGLAQFMLGFAPWWLWGLVMGVLLKPLLSWRMLKDEVLAVEAALQQSLPAGRERLSWLVSRDTTQLDAATVRESAIETLAENLSDSVIAPLFWFAVAGLPGAAVYRFANTADAMWGYPGMRSGRYWQWAGKWAARADDVLSWVPARITALLLAVVARGLPFAALARQARKTPSPNSGWPMAAMALALNVRLAKPGVYTLHSKGRRAGPLDTRRAARLGTQVVLAMVPVVAGLQLLVLVVFAWAHA